MTHAVVLVASAAVLAAASCSRVAAQPRVRVRAATTLQMTASADEEFLLAVGSLTDDAGEPLAGREVELTPVTTADTGGGARRVSAATDGAGRFAAQVRVEPAHRWTVLARFSGDTHFDAASVSVVAVATLEALALTFSGPRPRQIDLDREHALVTVRASAAGGSPAGVTLSLRDELGRQVADGTISADGEWRVAIPTSRLGPPGMGRFVASPTNGLAHAHTDAVIPVVRYRTSVIAAAATSTRDDVVVTGTVMDRDGHPLADQTVALTADGARFRTLVTSADGEFSATERARWQHGAPIQVVAVHESRVPWWVGSRSRPIAVTLASRPRPAWWWLLGAVAISCGLFAWFARASVDPARRRIVEQRWSLPVDVQLAPSRPREKPVDWIRAVVVDSTTLQRLPDVTVTCSARGEVAQTVTAADGTFELRNLPAGQVELRAEAPGYAATIATLTIPQRGEWTGARVALLSNKHAAFGVHRRSVAAWLRRLEPTSTLTAREAVELAAQRYGTAPKAALEQLTATFESAVYAAPTTTDEQLRDVVSAVQQVDTAIGDAHPESFDAPRGPSL